MVSSNITVLQFRYVVMLKNCLHIHSFIRQDFQKYTNFFLKKNLKTYGNYSVYLPNCYTNLASIINKCTLETDGFFKPIIFINLISFNCTL